MKPNNPPSGFGNLFTEEFKVKKEYMPWFAFSCCIALCGSMLFGIFFGGREAQSAHQIERIQLTTSFARVAQEKDIQIKNLTDVIIELQKKHLITTQKISDSDLRVEKYLVRESMRLGIVGPEVDALREHIIEAEAERLAEQRRQKQP